MLQQLRHITKWRSAFLDCGDLLYSIGQPKRGLTAIGQGHLETVFSCVHKTSCFSQFYNDRNIKLVSFQTIQCQNYSSYNRRPNFFSQFIENIKQEMVKNKEMKENLRKFREERKKLEQSDALKKARAKYMTLESEASKFKDKFEKVKDTVSGVFEEATKSDIAKKAGKISEELGKSARETAQSISEKSQKLGASDTFKTISEATAAVKEELGPTWSQATVYVAPAKLRKRQEVPEGGSKIFEADTTTVDMELHKDSRFYESWQNFKNNNPYVNKILDLKIKYDESENPMIRFSRFFTDKVSYALEGLFQNEISETLTEIVKMDPGFSKTKFVRQCETDIIPNILEAMVRGDLEILKDWCHEGPYNILSVPIKEIKAKGGIIESKILDIGNLELAGGKVMEQGPVLIITFTSQEIICVRDKTGKVIDGDPEKVLRVNNVWALSRDMTELDPKAAWRLLEFSSTSKLQFV